MIGASKWSRVAFAVWTALIILFLWIYYTSMILLLGAETASLYEDFHHAPAAGGREDTAQRPSPALSRGRVRA